VNAAPSKYRIVPIRHEQRYVKVLQKHDRKGELRASVLGIDPLDFRKRERKNSLKEIVAKCGFLDERAFYRAIIGKIREELRRRGWTPQRIEAFEASRLRRMSLVV
jgi:AraC-like DNA-binding protein